MNKVLTITGAFFSTLLVTLLAAGVAVQSPKVQTWIGKKAVAKIEKQLGGHFTFDEVRLNPFDALVLKNVVILDDSPYTGRPQQAVVDTFARADRETGRRPPPTSSASSVSPTTRKCRKTAATSSTSTASR